MTHTHTQTKDDIEAIWIRLLSGENSHIYREYKDWLYIKLIACSNPND